MAAAELRLGTRGSALALWQAEMVAARLRSQGNRVEIVVLKTTGDTRQDIPLPEMAGKGVFVREIEAALLRNEIDFAVHSAKDMQSADPPGLHIAAFCERADPRDAVVSPHGSLEKLPQRARVATGSPRRVAQLRHARPDLQFVEIRGNVDTRLAKLARGDADALVLAVAGLVRLGRAEVITEYLSVEHCLPQVGQGCVAVQCRADDAENTQRAAQTCDHPLTRSAVIAERAFLTLLGGGCTAPAAAHAAQRADESFDLTGLAASADGSLVVRASQSFAHGGEVLAAQSVYQQLIEQGAQEILQGTWTTTKSTL